MRSVVIAVWRMLIKIAIFLGVSISALMILWLAVISLRMFVRHVRLRRDEERRKKIMEEYETDRHQREAETQRQRAEQIRFHQEPTPREAEGMARVRESAGREMKRRQAQADMKVQQHREWMAFSDQAIAETEARKVLSDFPDPPQAICSDCESRAGDSPLKLCVHGLETIMRDGAKPLSTESVESWRWKWHPDRFACCPQDVRDGFQRKATVMFQVLGELAEKVTK
jgi:hypothetical protein